MNNRYLGAVTLIPFILILFLGGIYLKYGIMIISLMGMYEFYKVIKGRGINAINIIGYLLCIAYYVTLGTEANYKFVFFTIIVSMFMLLCIPVLDTEYNFIDVACTVFGFLYVSLFFSSMVLVDNMSYGRYFVWIIVISAWGCDTAAYYTGRFLGKRKLCPKVSPKKTVEGSIGGILGSVIICTLFGLFALKRGVPMTLHNYVAMGILCGFFCQFGDLTASSIKRYVKVKDYSNLIPGHGGILDRFDSILFSGVIVLYYLMFIAFI
ncbi:phosphatidate cytidylyltransferase [Clostridium sp. MT-14]|uniref:Phosphatidate cytidylyltransferase n=1 Tax=Clostridium aromativorans TaxID=2836848 RepID=A0ABS8N495_9CLOT|nr:MULTISPECIES: phosphatidate cytidylyltransferase [Clostridium]KAA8675030.1 phosphatidate cytidylyltransferase [Clostridium sp. HV4-5-A1G]MCC9294623.1 phosphatidate cytidylyltransferase [Clostridium aromativorans]CAB1243800.1 Phosphatidate cytidylyltransferase [Clostridiaceae bacterium BL-3]